MNGEYSIDAATWEPPGRPKRGPGRIIFWGLVGLSVVLVAAGIVLTRVQMRAFRVPSSGMAPTLQVGDELFVTPGTNVRRGDVIVFTRPGVNGPYVKRLIGLPGDHVACCDARGRVTVNGHPLDETYINRDGPPAQTPFSATLVKGQMWVLGDHRNASLDSRAWGPIPTSGIVGYGAAAGRGFPTRALRTPQTFVADGLAPHDQRVASYRIWSLLFSAGLIALLILAVFGIIWFTVRRARARRRQRHPAGVGLGPAS